MGPITRLRSRAAALAVTAGLALGGAVVLTPAPAQAALAETSFGFQATAYGARALAPQADLTLPRVAFSYIYCTRLAGRTTQNSLEDEIGLPLNDQQPLVKVNSVTSLTRSYRAPKRGIAGASQGTSRIGSIVVGGIDGGPELSFTGLRTTSTAWATTDGKLHARNQVSALDVDLVLPEAPATGTPLDDLLHAIKDQGSAAIGQVIDVLGDNAGGITIPGLGRISLLKGFNRRGVGRTTAYASSFLIRIQLFGQDQDESTLEDNIELNIGRSWARITKGVRSGVMAGVGVGGSETNRGGLGNSGDIGWKELPCEGTRGKVRTRTARSAEFGDTNQATATGLTGSSYGVQGRRGKAVAWTRGTVSRFELNGTDLVLEGVVGRATVRQSSSGAVSTSFAGSRIDRILVGGKVKARDVTPANASLVRLGTIPGVSAIRFFVRDTWRRGGNITAVKVTLTEATGTSTQNLGYARTAIKRY
ncbi:hypothetical protein [Nocardioides marmoribigeumensis]|uniref:Uncharacterized protein n=1 Tax=Nocardioides marmoribigeumensis TaxID=433649 RepID=A0ABU2BYZ5_9ACTN|nr:hypothetical protein [Nocardioides marmoribigeumensis]MDR7363594.1 hypothetical protein [Nocardioides marmoribigeumensis]